MHGQQNIKKKIIFDCAACFDLFSSRHLAQAKNMYEKQHFTCDTFLITTI
jgi:hypothetical protein